MSNDILKELRAITKNKECWKENIDNVTENTSKIAYEIEWKLFI